MPTIPASLSTLFPVPERVALAGSDYLIGEFRLRDIRDLEVGIAGIAPHPMAGVQGDPEAGDDGRSDRLSRLSLAYPKSLNWPPGWGTKAWSEALDTRRGRALYLGVALCRHNEDVTKAEVSTLARSLAVAEWVEVDRVAWGLKWHELIAAELDRADNPARRRDESTVEWGAQVAFLMETYGLSPDAVLDLSLSLYHALLRKGKPEEVGREVDPEKSAALAASQAINDPTPFYALLMKRGRDPATVPIRFGGCQTPEAEEEARSAHNAKVRAGWSPKVRAINDALEAEQAREEAERSAERGGSDHPPP